MSETPEQIWINKIHGRHPEDWSFSVGAWETQSQLKEKVKYIRADYVDALLKAEREKALREAAAVSKQIADQYIGYMGRIEKAILALISEDATDG